MNIGYSCLANVNLYKNLWEFRKQNTIPVSFLFFPPVCYHYCTTFTSFPRIFYTKTLFI